MKKNENQAKIILGFNCNNHCQFCYEKENRYLPDKSTVEAKREILAAKKKGRKKIHFIGGEPTIRSDILDLVNYAKEIGFERVHITTNGRMFAYPNFAKKMVDIGVLEIVFSVHGHSAKVYDSQTNVSGSFDQLVRGVKNLKKMKFEKIGTNTAVTKINYRYLPQIGDMLTRWKIRRAEFIYVAIMNHNNFSNYTPIASKAAPYISSALSKGEKHGYQWDLLNPPMGCYFEKYFGSNIIYSDSRNEELLLDTDASNKIHEVSKKKVLNYVKIEKCKDCSIENKCKGVWSSYLKNYGDEEIKAIQNKLP